MELTSKYASAERSSDNEINVSRNIIASIENLTEIFNSTTSIASIIDSNRQVVFANEKFLSSLGITTIEEVIGKRPGEIVGCVNHDSETGGCGTSAKCRYCGAVNTILNSQKLSEKVENEARITVLSGSQPKSLDLKVTCAPILLSGIKFYVFTIDDISTEKRKQNLERIFFHDILNLAGALNGLLTVLKSESFPASLRELVFRSEETSRVMVEEILTHRQLTAAEDGDLAVNVEELNTSEVLKSAISKILFHSVSAGKKIEVDKNTVDIVFNSDRNIIERILLNLLKNALEASQVNETVWCGCDSSGLTITFWVKNAAVMPEEVQNQIFQRSFSTKGKGRGLGTYSIRLLTENYLKGSVAFQSSPSEGTIFTVRLDR